MHTIILTCGDSLTTVLITDSISEYFLPDRTWYDFVCPWSHYSCCYQSWCGTADSAMDQPYFCRISACHSQLGESGLILYYTCKQHTYSHDNMYTAAHVHASTHYHTLQLLLHDCITTPGLLD